jgi:hypothetical protein
VDGNGDAKEEKFDKGEIWKALKEINSADKTRSFFAHKERGRGVGEHVLTEEKDEKQSSDRV